MDRSTLPKYEGLGPIYTEYNVGNYTRSFQLSNKIDQERISADLQDGVITQPRRRSRARSK